MHSYSYPDYIENRWGDRVLFSARSRGVFNQGYSPRQNGKLQIRANDLEVWTQEERHQMMSGFANDFYNHSTSSYTYTSGSLHSRGNPIVERPHSEAIVEAQNKFIEVVNPN